MPQLKVDWASWLDEDEETECSVAPNGFDVPAMKMMMVDSDHDPLYRDLDKFSSSDTPDEGEEMDSIVIDEGVNSVDDLQIKFQALEYEKQETAKTKAARHDLRKRTREAQLFMEQRERDLRYGRPTRELTPEELELISRADGLYARLKAEKATEKKYWLSKWWHQRRPERRKIDLAWPLALSAAREQLTLELAQLRQSGEEAWGAKERRQVERRIFLCARQAACDKFNEWACESTDPLTRTQDQEGKDFTARDMAARITREQVALALHEPVPVLAKSMQLKQFADPRPARGRACSSGDDRAIDDDSDDESTDNDEAEAQGWVTIKEKKSPKGPAELPAPPPANPLATMSDADDAPELELEDNSGVLFDGDGHVLEHDGGGDGDESDSVELEENA